MTKGCPGYSLGDTNRRPKLYFRESSPPSVPTLGLIDIHKVEGSPKPRPLSRRYPRRTTAAVISRGECTFVDRWPVLLVYWHRWIGCDKGSTRSSLSRETVNRDKSEGSSIQLRDCYYIFQLFFQTLIFIETFVDFTFRLITLEESGWNNGEKWFLKIGALMACGIAIIILQADESKTMIFYRGSEFLSLCPQCRGSSI